jgi:hypothetical protein
VVAIKIEKRRASIHAVQSALAPPASAYHYPDPVRNQDARASLRYHSPAGIRTYG